MTEVIEERRPVGQPLVRRTVSRRCRRVVVLEGGVRLVDAVSNDHRRTGVAVPQLPTHSLELAGLLNVDVFGNLGSYSVARRSGILDTGTHQLPGADGLVGLAPGENEASCFTSLDSVAGQEHRTAPAVDDGGELPAEVGSVADADVHAEATHGRHEVSSVSDQECAAEVVPRHLQRVDHEGSATERLDFELLANRTEEHRPAMLPTCHHRRLREPAS